MTKSKNVKIETFMLNRSNCDQKTRNKSARKTKTVCLPRITKT